MPRYARLLGHQASGVMPGWVLTSSRIEARPRPARRPSGNRSASAPAAEQRGAPRSAIASAASRDLVGDVGRADMLGQPVGIFGVVIVEAGLGLELGHRQRLVAEHRDGQLAAADEGLGEQPLELLPRALRRRGRSDRRNCRSSRDDRDADRRALVDRLQHIGPRQRIGLRRGSRSRRSARRACGCRAAPAPSWSAPCRSRSPRSRGPLWV